MAGNLLMRKLIFFVAVSAFSQSITPGSLEMTDITHESARVLFQTGGSWSRARVRIVVGTSGCAGGTAGTTYVNGIGPNSGVPGEPSEVIKNKYSIPFMLLSPGTAYNICPEISADGTTWFGGQGINFTTDALPATHPVPPVAPATFDTSVPNTTGFTPVSATSNDDCTDIRNKLLAAISGSLDGRSGTVITIPAGSTCTGNIMPTVTPPDVVVLHDTNFNTTTHNITSTGHGLSEGQAIVWNASYRNAPPFDAGQMPGSGAFIGTDAHPFDPGTVTYVHVIDANTFQVFANAPSGTSCGNATHANQQKCPQLWAFDSTGAGEIQYAKWPRAVKPIIVETSAIAAGEFPPEHVRVNPNWKPKMATIQAPNSYLGSTSKRRYVFSTNCDTGGSVECAWHWFTANIRFIGIEFTYAPVVQIGLMQDPDPGEELIITDNSSSGIIFDRCWIHGQPPPFRVNRMLGWHGKNQAIVDSYINNMHLPRQHKLNLTGTGDGLGVH
jgi:hypothetical protein